MKNKGNMERNISISIWNMILQLSYLKFAKKSHVPKLLCQLGVSRITFLYRSYILTGNN